VYDLEFAYDLDGRRTGVEHPTWLSPGNDSTLYAYESATGRLSSVTNALGDEWSYSYDPRSRVAKVNLPSMPDSIQYDDANRVLERDVWPSGVYLGYDKGGLLISDGTFSWVYNGFGHLTQANAQDEEQFGRDAFGNALTYTVPTRLDGEQTPAEWSFDLGYAVSGTSTPAGGRILTVEQTWPGTDPTNWESYKDESSYTYDTSGNLVLTTETRHYVNVSGSNVATPLNTEWEMSSSYYASDGKLMVHQVTRDTAAYSSGYYDEASWGVYEEYWYDALGRRILQRSRQDSPICTISSRCQSSMTRYVWDGAQILWEIRSDSLDVKNPSGSGLTGQTGSIGYVHAGGIDAPVGMIRNGTSLILNRDLRGLYFEVTDTAGDYTFDVDLPGATWSAQGVDYDLKDTQIWAGKWCAAAFRGQVRIRRSYAQRARASELAR
jgi:YD repeat-containing protein